MRKTISNSEWEILEKLWDKGDMTIAQLEAAFRTRPDGRGMRLSLFLKKMEAKNLVAYEEIRPGKDITVPCRRRIRLCKGGVRSFFKQSL